MTNMFCSACQKYCGHLTYKTHKGVKAHCTLCKRIRTIVPQEMHPTKVEKAQPRNVDFSTES